MRSPYLVQDSRPSGGTAMLRVILHQLPYPRNSLKGCPGVCYHGDSKSPQVVSEISPSHRHRGALPTPPCVLLTKIPL